MPSGRARWRGGHHEAQAQPTGPAGGRDRCRAGDGVGGSRIPALPGAGGRSSRTCLGRIRPAGPPRGVAGGARHHLRPRGCRACGDGERRDHHRQPQRGGGPRRGRRTDRPHGRGRRDRAQGPPDRRRQVRLCRPDRGPRYRRSGESGGGGGRDLRHLLHTGIEAHLSGGTAGRAGDRICPQRRPERSRRSGTVLRRGADRCARHPDRRA